MKIKFTLKELRDMLATASDLVENQGGSCYVELDTAEIGQMRVDGPFRPAFFQRVKHNEYLKRYTIGEIVEFGDMTEQGARRIVDELKRLGTYDKAHNFYAVPGDLVGEILYFMAGPHPDGWNHPYIKELCSDMIVFEIDGERTAFA